MYVLSHIHMSIHNAVILHMSVKVLIFTDSWTKNTAAMNKHKSRSVEHLKLH